VAQPTIREGVNDPSNLGNESLKELVLFTRSITENIAFYRTNKNRFFGSGYGTTHGSSYFKTYSTIPPHMTLFK